MKKIKEKRGTKYLVIIVMVSVGILYSMFQNNLVVHASGLVDDTVNADNFYSRYPLENYQLDFSALSSPD